MEVIADLKLVLLGKTGVGKSESGNTILGRQAFKSKKSFTSVTQDVAVESETVCGFSVTVYDTPGFSDTDMSEEKIQHIHDKVLQRCETGLCAFLLVIKAERFTENKRRTVEKIEKLLGEKRLEKTWILFTGGDELEDDDMTIQEFINETESLKKLVQKYDHRYHVFNNKKRGHTIQVQMLFEKIHTAFGYSNKITCGLDLACAHADSSIVRFSDLKRSSNPLLSIPSLPISSSPIHTPLLTLLHSSPFRLHQYTTVVDAAQASPLVRTVFKPVTAADRPSRRILLLGKTGVGRSAAGNTILGKKVFQSVMGINAVTLECSEEHGTVSGRTVFVVDTPGFFNTEMTLEKLITEMARSVCLSSPGPHACLIVFRVDERFTEQEKKILQQIEMFFGQEVLKYSIILFTGGDQLEEETIEELIQKNKHLGCLVDQCGGRYHVFNNKEKKNREQVNDLLQKIDVMIEQNGGGHYSNHIFQHAQRNKHEQEKTMPRGIIHKRKKVKRTFMMIMREREEMMRERVKMMREREEMMMRERVEMMMRERVEMMMRERAEIKMSESERMMRMMRMESKSESEGMMRMMRMESEERSLRKLRMKTNKSEQRPK